MKLTLYRTSGDPVDPLTEEQEKLIGPLLPGSYAYKLKGVELGFDCKTIEVCSLEDFSDIIRTYGDCIVSGSFSTGLDLEIYDDYRE